MSVDQYLRKVGALPSYKRSDIFCGLALICEELFEPKSVQEPDCVSWTQQSPYTDEDNFDLRCDFILYGTSGNVTELLATARKSPTYLAEEALEQLLKIRLFNYACYLYFHVNNEEGPEPWDQDFESDQWNVDLMNEFVELEGDERFSTWDQVLNVYKDGTLSECGIKSVARFLASPPQKYSYRGHPEILYPNEVIPENVKSLLCLQ
jgi:hypothetical protein